MTELYMRIGQAAERLGVKVHQLRKLCQAGLIEAEKTDGGQWRIPTQVVEHLAKQGVPPVPVGLEPDKGGKENGGRGIGTRAQRPGAALLGAPSSAAKQAVESALISENTLTAKRNQVEVRRLERDETEIDDFFEDRERRREERDQEYVRRAHENEQQEQQRTQAQQVAQRYREWRDEWLSYAQRSRPYDAPESLGIDIVNEVEQVLESLDPGRDYYVVRGLVDAAIQRGLEGWNKEKQRQAAIDRVLWLLDYDMKADPEWNSRLRQAADDAIRAGASQSEMESAGTAAVQPIIKEFEHAKRCRDIVANSGWKLQDATPEDWEDAKDAVREALAALPIGASQRQLEAARDTALTPIQEEIAQRQSREAAEAEQQRSRQAAAQDEALRKTVLSSVRYHLPYGLSEQEESAACDEAADALAELPAGTSRWDLEKARDAVLERYEAKQRLVDAGLREIRPYAEKLLMRYRFDARTTAGDIEGRVKSEVEAALREELDGTEADQFVIDRVRQLVRELEGC